VPFGNFVAFLFFNSIFLKEEAGQEEQFFPALTENFKVKQVARFRQTQEK